MPDKVRKLLIKYNADAMLINSTNQFLVEYNSLEENSRYKLTGFSGSTGDAVVTNDKIYLFVDGRYHTQADNEVNHNLVSVIKLSNGETFISKMFEIFPENTTLAIVAAKNSQAKAEQLSKHFTLKFLDRDPYDTDSIKRIENIVRIDTSLCGISTETKLKKIREHIGANDAYLITSPEEVSYVFNIRDYSMAYSSKVMRKAIITNDSAELYSALDFEDYKKALLSVNGKIFIDKSSINAEDYNLVKDKAVECNDYDDYPINIISYMKSIKSDAEIDHYMSAFERTDKAIKGIKNFIENNSDISEFDIEQQLEHEFKKYGAISLSFKSIVAKDKNSALAHYSKSSKNEVIREGSLILIDCGAYYEGGLATDITRVFVKGTPAELHKKVYTTVLKAFLLAFNTPIIDGLSGFDIDNKVREFFKSNPIDGFVFNHGLGHGIGIGVHEYPPNLSCNKFAKINLKDNMCFTIEPGLYNSSHFGIRLENSCYTKNKEIKSFTKMNFEKKLIEYSMLSNTEIDILSKFEVL